VTLGVVLGVALGIALGVALGLVLGDALGRFDLLMTASRTSLLSRENKTGSRRQR
jgi:hypothetical protein